jgi:hypothetical protein
MAASLDSRLTTGAEEPHLTFEDEAWRSIVAWATETDREVSGIGLVEPVGDDFRVKNVYLLRQIATDWETELDPGALAVLVGELVERGVDPAGIRLWWHSHGHEAPFWSGVDERTIVSFSPNAMISLVVDHRLRRLARLDRFAPRGTAWVWVDVPDTSPDEAARAAARRDLARHVQAVPGAAR